MPVERVGETDISGVESPQQGPPRGRGRQPVAKPPDSPPPAPAQEEHQARDPKGTNQAEAGLAAAGPPGAAAMTEGFHPGGKFGATAGPNPFYPIDTDKMLKADAYQAWHIGRSVYDAFYGAFLDHRAIQSSLRTTWEQNSAQASLTRFLIGGFNPAELLPPGTVDPLTQRQQMTSKSGAEAQTTALTAGADPTNIVAGAPGKLGMAAALLTPLAMGAVFGGQDPVAEGEKILGDTAKVDLRNPQWYADLLWSAGTAMLLAGGARAGMRGPLAKLLPGWEHAQSELDRSIAEANAHQVSIQDPATHDPGFDWMKAVNEIEPPAREKVLKTGTGDQPRTRILHETIDDKGHIQQVDITERKRRDSVAGFKKERGIESPADLPIAAEREPFTGAEAKYMVDNWKKMEMPYDLTYRQPEEADFGVPQDHADAIVAQHDEPTVGAYINMTNLGHALLSHINSGPFTTSQAISVLRSLNGTNRATGWLQSGLMHEMSAMFHDKAPNTQLMYRALEGRQEALDALSPLERSAVALIHQLYKANDLKARSIGQRDDSIVNFAPRIRSQPERLPTGMRRPRGQQAALTTAESQKHRALSISTDEASGELYAHQEYATAEEANKALQAEREHYLQALSDPQQAIPATLAGDPEVLRRRDALAAAADESARRKAKGDLTQYINHKIPLYEEDFFKAIDSHLAHQIRSIHAYQAAQMMSTSLAKVQSKALGAVAKFAAYDARPGAKLEQREREQLQALGYRHANAPGYGDWLFHPKAAQMIDRANASTAAHKALLEHQVAAGLIKAEQALISELMYIPTIHGVNMSERIGNFTMAHPLLASQWLRKKGSAKTVADIVSPVVSAVARHGGQDWYTMERDAIERRVEAFRHGVAPPSRAARFGSELMAALGNGNGDPEYLAEARPRDLGGEAPKPAHALVKAGRVLKGVHDHHNETFWNQINEFGVGTWEVLRDAALHARGMDPERLSAAQAELKEVLQRRAKEEDANKLMALVRQGQKLSTEIREHQLAHNNAGLYAAKQANTWMGHVLPEDWNPVLHEVLRLGLFAPNWWRTKLELLMPIYRDAGFDVDSAMLTHMALNEVKTLAGQFFWQKATGNVLNLATSGHFQNQNQAGAKDQIELTLPWTDYLPQAIGVKRSDPRTGALRTWENPMARQTKEVERAFGLQQQDTQQGEGIPIVGNPQLPSLQDLWHGGTHAFADRLSPLVDLGAGLANIDLHRSIIDGTPRHLDPTSDSPTPLSAIAAAMLVIPGGSDLLYQLQQESRKEKIDTPWPTVFTKGVEAAAGGWQKGVLATGLSWLLGVNPSFDTAEKTTGQLPSDEMYRMAREEQQSYEQQMHEQSTRTLAGEQSPATWRKWYHDRVLEHQSTMRHVYQNSPNAVNGTLGMVARWEALYDQATDSKTGQLDYDKLNALQADFRGKEKPADLQAMDDELHKNDTKYPMLKLYHQTLAAYDQWQKDYASQRGLPEGELPKEIKEYGALPGPAARTRYLQTHAALRGMHQARTTQFERTPVGLMYGLFYDSSAVQRWLESHHETAAQVVPEAAAAEGVDLSVGG